ncbi:hypothetical protein [uncultured Sulfitobacter sp.]|uniref:hypothetical protein n=1 Tax=uncultured Sulfitobacter sp. TaxID=191468 RepID=UPI00261D574E|nr:hypothetical protein [uncultured Sulfitobacter sp.]
MATDTPLRFFCGSTCQTTDGMRENDGGTEFGGIITGMVECARLRKEMPGAQRFIASNHRSMAERGKPAFTRRMVMRMAPP